MKRLMLDVLMCVCFCAGIVLMFCDMTDFHLIPFVLTKLGGVFFLYGAYVLLEVSHPNLMKEEI